MIWSKGKEQQQRRGSLKQAAAGSLDFVSDFSHYLIKWDQPISSTALPAYTQKGLYLDCSGITSGSALLVLSSRQLSDLQASLAVGLQGFTEVVWALHNES